MQITQKNLLAVDPYSLNFFVVSDLMHMDLKVIKGHPCYLFKYEPLHCNGFDLGYRDMGEYWRSWYEVDTFEENMRKLFDELEPLYKELHGYVINKLIKYYGAEKFPGSGHIPAHLLGMFLQIHNMYSFVYCSLF